MTRMWRADGDRLVPLCDQALASETKLETWLEKDPGLLGLDLLWIGRQVQTSDGGRIDLLGIDVEGALWVAELKKGRTPRDVIAQILDYASWVSKLPTKEIHERASVYLGRPLAAIFPERFGCPAPEPLNATHHLVIVASEFDDSSRRIVEYLAEQHSLSINTFFFGCFRDGETEYLTADWMLDPEEVSERSTERDKAPWSGLWWVNADLEDRYRRPEDRTHNWDDMRKFGYVAASGAKRLKALQRLSVGSHFFAYFAGRGYIGYGIVRGEPVVVHEFRTADGRTLAEAGLKQPTILANRDNPENAEYLVPVEWKKTFPLDQAKTFPGAFAVPHVVCRLRDEPTVKFLSQEFGVESLGT